MSRRRRNPSAAVLPVALSSAAGLAVGGLAVYLYDKHRAAAAASPAPSGAMGFGLIGPQSLLGSATLNPLEPPPPAPPALVLVGPFVHGAQVQYNGPMFAGDPWFLTPGAVYTVCGEGAPGPEGRTCILAGYRVNVNGSRVAVGRVSVPTGQLAGFFGS